MFEVSMHVSFEFCFRASAIFLITSAFPSRTNQGRVKVCVRIRNSETDIPRRSAINCVVCGRTRRSLTTSIAIVPQHGLKRRSTVTLLALASFNIWKQSVKVHRSEKLWYQLTSLNATPERMGLLCPRYPTRLRRTMFSSSSSKILDFVSIMGSVKGPRKTYLPT